MILEKAPDRLHNISKRYRIACSMKIKINERTQNVQNHN